MSIQDLEVTALDRLLYTLEEKSYFFLCENDDEFRDFIVSLHKDVRMHAEMLRQKPSIHSVAKG
jgi:signal-transduction protein with cAMP-binding, CBS, and nucleotidyltransferase domain